MAPTESSTTDAQAGAAQQLVAQVAVVTGGASGIGRATVRALAREGATIAVVDRDGDGAARAATEAGRVGVEALPFAVDLSESAAVVTLIETILMQFGRIDLLVNSAGISGGRQSSLDFTEETFNEVFAINVLAPF